MTIQAEIEVIGADISAVLFNLIRNSKALFTTVKLLNVSLSDSVTSIIRKK